MDRKEALNHQLVSWFRQNARDLPWRRTRDPYQIWVSEIMLQQTQVQTTIPYFARFIDRFPRVEALAAAAEGEVLQLWEGLGYYRRARQLHAAAQVIVDQHDGVFPDRFDDVLALPGIGRYTAGAILSIAGDQPLPILEANTVRLFCRLSGQQGDPTQQSIRNQLWEFSESLLPKKGCGEFNQALMELGSSICVPRKPNCGGCPVQDHCQAFALGVQHDIPPKKIKRYEDVTHCLVVVRKGDGRILLRRCGSEERWAGLWDFPRFEVNAENLANLQYESAEKVQRQTGMTVNAGEIFRTLKHGVTRFRITLKCIEAQWTSGRISKSLGEMVWVRPSQLSDYPMNTTGRKVADGLQATQRG